MAKFRVHVIAVVVTFFSFSLFGQERLLTVYPTFLSGIYTYRPLNIKESNPLVIPDISMVKDKLYAEVRYNYDYINTSAMYIGKNISLSKQSGQTLIPQIGLLYGDYKGAFLQFYYQLEQSGFVIDFQNQYGISFNRRPGFYYNWSDIQFPIAKKIKFGNSIQLHAGKDLSTFDYGLFLLYRSADWTLALYSFDFYDLSKHFFVLEIQRAIIFKMNRKHKF
jgi:hypothetical protein